MAPTAKDLELDAIAKDVQFVGRLFGSLQRPGTPERVVSIAPLSVIAFLALFVYEAEGKLSLAPTWRAADTERVMARSRHALKLFDDTKRDLEGQVAFFRDEIEPAHRRRFLRPIPWPWAKDLGIYKYEDRPISNTHVASFLTGYDPPKLFTRGMSDELRSIASDYGRYFAALGASLDPTAESFASRWDSSRLKGVDERADRYYRGLFAGATSREINPLLGLFQALINFATFVLPLDPVPESWQTIFKIRFLTLYHVLSGLAKLRASGRISPSGGAAHLDAILNTSEAATLLSSSVRPVRNTLMHYGPDPRLALTSLDLGMPLYGLPEACCGGRDAPWLESVVTKQIELTAAELQAWAGA